MDLSLHDVRSVRLIPTDLGPSNQVLKLEVVAAGYTFEVKLFGASAMPVVEFGPKREAE